MSNKSTILLPASIDEETEFPAVDLPPKTIIFDLGALRMMNSSGIRSWILWAKPLAAQAEIRLQNVPMMFLNLSSIISNVLVPEMIIESIRLEYVYGYADETRTVLFTRPSDAQPMTVPLQILIEGRVFEFGGLVDKTFARLKDQFTFVDSIEAKDLKSIFGTLV